MTLIDPNPREPDAYTLELDELWSFVTKKTNTVWIWLAMRLVIVMKPPVVSSGALFRLSIGRVHVTPTFGRPIKRSFRSLNTVQSEKRVDKPHILSDSTIHCANACHVWFASILSITAGCADSTPSRSPL